MVLNGADELAKALKSAGLKLTPQRLAIVECLVGNQTHPTAQELFERLRPRFPSMSVATVYNTLGALTEIGVVRPLDMGGATRFDPNAAPHHHAVCERCGAIRDVMLKETRSDGTVGESEPLPGFVVRRIERIYRGLCADCSTAASS